ncbi:sphingomyelin phosphodiesterase-like [Oppia nitens]|uniref:sphingomyelin phosphodiesterase-like n=1 Tax=Oppia nitens TaxID=1686743 RepID=UPI0023DB190F|nr:sphingomyelin phosphodiesterase-like [Oppia nitens]
MKLFYSVKEGLSSTLTCLACNALVDIIFNRWLSADLLSVAFINICSGLRLTTYEVCEGYISLFKSQVDYIRGNTNLDTTEICGLLMGDQCYSGTSNNLYWKLDIPQNRQSDYDTTSRKRVVKNKKNYKILHLTDIHLDLEYIPFKGSHCGTPYCCRKSTYNGVSVPNASVNYWGSYPCDTPLQTLDNTFRHIDWSSIDWTYWTGDVTPHDTWRDSKQISLKTTEIIVGYFKAFSKNKLVVPAIGNHVTIPVGSFPPPTLQNNLSISWLYDNLVNHWSQWLPKESLQTFQYAGYYSLKLRPGFKIIVVNTNYCARLNIWTYYRSIDPADQLKWLIYELELAEKADESVHIVGHIPTDNRECTQSWLYNYMAIVERFSDTIVGQFFGHTHYDEFRILYSVNNYSKPIGLEIISPSLTTYAESNPAYRIISCKSNGQITDMETYAFDLIDANEDNRSTPNWYYEYSMAKSYSLSAFNAQEFDDLIRTVATDNNYLQMYHSHSHRYSTFAANSCDDGCRQRIMSETMIGNPYNQKLKPILETVVQNQRIIYNFTKYLPES